MLQFLRSNMDRILILVCVLGVLLTLIGCEPGPTPDDRRERTTGHAATPSLECVDEYIRCTTDVEGASVPACRERYERCIRGMPCSPDPYVGCIEVLNHQ